MQIYNVMENVNAMLFVLLTLHWEAKTSSLFEKLRLDDNKSCLDNFYTKKEFR